MSELLVTLVLVAFLFGTVVGYALLGGGWHGLTSVEQPCSSFLTKDALLHMNAALQRVTAQKM